MRNIPGLGIALVLLALAVWWLIFKFRAGASGVRAHRQLLATDAYYRSLRAQAEQERRMGDSHGYYEERAQLHLLEHLRDTGGLTAEEFAQAAARVKASHGRGGPSP